MKEGRKNKRRGRGTGGKGGKQDDPPASLTFTVPLKILQHKPKAMAGDWDLGWWPAHLLHTLNREGELLNLTSQRPRFKKAAEGSSD